METQLENLLGQRRIRPTAVRLLILRTMAGADCALSQAQIESALSTVDKSSISRTLSLFVSRHLAHRLPGPDGVMLYALCAPGCRCHDEQAPNPDDLHLHFTCEVCHKTYCLRYLPVPRVSLPDGFTFSSASFIVRGICPECQKH